MHSKIKTLINVWHSFTVRHSSTLQQNRYHISTRQTHNPVNLHVQILHSQNGACGCVQVGVNRLDHRCLDTVVKITIIMCFWFKSYRLSCVRSLVSCLSSSKAVHQHAEWLAFQNGRRNLIIYFVRYTTVQNDKIRGIRGKCSNKSNVYDVWCWWAEATANCMSLTSRKKMSSKRQLIEFACLSFMYR